jgi:hypothetical protein
MDKDDYRHTHRIFNNYCFSMATMVTRTQLLVTLIRACLRRLLDDRIFNITVTIRYF